MPLPRPKDEEKRQEFIQRCMSDEEIRKEFGTNAQRYAVCVRIWDKKKENEDD